eukprot:2211052-Alexandrium_andersonii.AAC.1
MRYRRKLQPNRVIRARMRKVWLSPQEIDAEIERLDIAIQAAEGASISVSATGHDPLLGGGV